MGPGAPQDDDVRKHVLLAMAGSDVAFGEVVRAHQGALIALLTRVCGGRAAAEDAAQAAFVKAWRNIRSLRDANLFRPWLRRIAMRAAIDAARGHQRGDALDEDVASEHAAIGADARLDLEAALAKLSIAQRATVLLSYGEGMSHAEIAEELNMPVGTVKSHVARGARTLRQLLSDEGSQ
jgi:RNA polymerase sigma-70 factor (ECF subfamily)